MIDERAALCWVAGVDGCRGGWVVALALVSADNALMDVQLQDTVVEAHPELAFTAFAGHPMRHSKRTPEGRRERLSLLRRVLGKACIDPVRVRVAHGLSRVGLDDVLDACALAVVADRCRRGLAQRLPQHEPQRDARGLRMEIWCG